MEDTDMWRYSANGITKYNPIHRDEEGRYTKDEWTDYSDVGNVVAGQLLTYEEYAEVERKYIQSVFVFLHHYGCTSVRINSLEKHSSKKSFYSRDIGRYDLYKSIKEGQIVFLTELEEILILILRSYLWCELYGDKNNAVVRFGYDYYMYFNVDGRSLDKKVIKQIEDIGLYVG